jgi:DNA (cytosine-5)-methyltransferase 1
MGLPETYKLPEKYNQAYHLTGDGVAVPVVRYIAENIFEPIVEHSKEVDLLNGGRDTVQEECRAKSASGRSR